MFYSTDEDGWLERKGWEIAAKTGWPMPICKSEAMADLQRLKQRPKATVTQIAQREQRMR